MRGSKPAQLFSLSAAAIFILTVFYTLTSHSEWTPLSSSLTDGIATTLGRSSLKAVMAHSEKMWEKTVRQRHELMEIFPNVGL